MTEAKVQCSNCSWYNHETKTCLNEELSNLKYEYTGGTDDFRDYFNKKDGVKYVGAKYKCELFLVV
jgi:hypothetical protein